MATFTFCSVTNSVDGLRGLCRVVKPEGYILLLEHVRIDMPVIGNLMDLSLPGLQATGANINRRTVDNLARSGLRS